MSGYKPWKPNILRKHQKGRNKYMARFGRFLLELEENDDDGDKFFTRMRWVGPDEISEIRINLSRRFPAWGSDQLIPVYRRTGTYYECQWHVQVPGFYRLDEVDFDDEQNNWRFWEECADGIPWAHRNFYWKQFESKMQQAEMSGREKWRESRARAEAILIDAKKKEENQKHGSGVYFIRHGDTRLFKIGKSVHPMMRMRDLQGANPIELTMHTVHPHKEPGEMERVYHKMFAEKRVRGEWFELSKQDMELVELIIQRSMEDGK
jgi:hypothetical protein